MNKKWPQLCGACWGTCLHFYSTYTFINDSYVSDKFAGHKVQMCGKKRRLKYSKKKSFLLGIGQKKGGVAGPTIFKHAYSRVDLGISAISAIIKARDIKFGITVSVLTMQIKLILNVACHAHRLHKSIIKFNSSIC